MLQSALEVEIADYMERNRNQTEKRGHRLVIRNGYLPERELTTGVGPAEIDKLGERKDACKKIMGPIGLGEMLELGG